MFFYSPCNGLSRNLSIDGAMGGPTGGRQRPWVAFWPWPLSIAVHVGLLALGSWLGDWKSHFLPTKLIVLILSILKWMVHITLNFDMDGSYYFEY